MKNQVVKALSAAMCIFLMVGAISGCSNKKGESSTKEQSKTVDTNLNAKGFPIVNNKITLSALVAKHVSQQPWDQLWFWQEYEKMTNIHIEWELVDDNAYVEKRNIKIASGNLPDILFRAKLSPDDEFNYAKNNVIIELGKYFNDNAPNIQALVNKYPDLTKSIALADGKIYSLPQIKVADYTGNSIGNAGGKLYIRKDWMKKLNLNMPKTVDEYYEVLKVFRDKDPNGNGKNDEIPLIGQKPGNDVTPGVFQFLLGVRSWWGLGTRGVNNSGYIDIDEAGKLRFIPTSDKYKEVLQFVSKLYKEGLLDKESFVQDITQVKAKAKKDQIGTFFSGNPTNVYTVSDEELLAKFDQVPVLKSQYGMGIYGWVTSVFDAGGTFAITKANKYPEATVRWIDYFYGSEGSDMLRFGKEGVHSQSTSERKMLISVDDYGKFLIRAGGGIPHFIDGDKDESFNSKAVQTLLKDSKAIYGPYIPKKQWSDFSYTADENKIRITAYKDINTYISEKVSSYIAEGNFSDWEDYKSRLDKMGLKDLMKIYQSALDRAGYEKK